MKLLTLSLAACAGIALIGPACRPAADDHGHDHGHDHEPKTAQITVWTGRYEVFAEHRAPVAGQPTTFITHVTDLQTLEPRREGMVKFILRQGDTVAEHPQAAPARAGIYLPGLSFPKPGDWQLTLLIPTDGSNAPVELGPIKVYASAHDADHADIPDGPDGVSFLKEQQWKILSKAEPTGKRRLVERLRVPAVVAARPGGLAQVTTPMAGRVLPAPGRTLPGIGDRVEAGQVMAHFQPSFSEFAVRLAEAEAEVARAQLAVEQANLTFRRVETLAAAEAKSGRELQEAEFALKSAQARLAAAHTLQATYRQAGAPASAGAPAAPALELKSPIAGVITEDRRTPAGEHVAAETLLFTVLDPRRVYLEGRVPEAGIARLDDARGARYERPGAPGQFTDLSEDAGRLVFTGLRVDPATRTVPIIYEAGNPDGRLRVGQWLNLHVETRRSEETVALPESAIIEEGGQPVAFVQVGGETFEKRELTLGIRDGQWVQVLSGVREGERVVTKGAMAIRLASASSVIPAHGHAH